MPSGTLSPEKIRELARASAEAALRQAPKYTANASRASAKMLGGCTCPKRDGFVARWSLQCLS
jgi:hypothetical protein